MAPAGSFHPSSSSSTLHHWLLCALTQAHAWNNIEKFFDREAESLVLSLARSLESRDPYTEGHCERLSGYAVRLGQRVGLPQEKLQALAIGGIVHDVGKVMIPEAILMKPGLLTADERRVIQQHPIAGEQICAPLEAFRHVLPIIRHHHERMDGSGYPDGLRGIEIPLTARILQTVDVYDALTMDRPYRKALPVREALAIMHHEAQRGWLDGALLGWLAPIATELIEHAPRRTPAPLLA